MEERYGSQRCGGVYRLQQAQGAGTRTGLKAQFGTGSSKKSEFRQTQCQLEEVVFNLEQAVRKFNDNEIQDYHSGSHEESGRSL